MNLEDIGSLLSNLSDEDMANLNQAAQQLFGGDEKQAPTPEPLGGTDPQMMAKIMQLLPLLQSQGDNERTRLIHALKPLLSPHRRKKADEALQLIQLLDMLPLIENLM